MEEPGTPTRPEASADDTPAVLAGAWPQGRGLS